MKRPAAPTLQARIALESKVNKSQQEGTVNFYCEPVNYLFGAYAKDDITGETDGDMMRFHRHWLSRLQDTLKPFGITCFDVTEYIMDM